KHLRGCFGVLHLPHEIKTDNGPACISCTFADLCKLRGIRHHTGIPHLPAGQAVVEQAHQT
ncbi:POK10 protein, partial [Alopecoenas beccarii]|nr:POK10 protein [Alopecoenas beccarii]